MIAGDQREGVLGEVVGARVPHIDHVQAGQVPLEGQDQPGQGAAGGADVVAEPGHVGGGPCQRGVELGGGDELLADQVGEGVEGGAGGEVAGAVPAHAVGDEEDGRLGEEGVLVDGPQQADVGQSAVGDAEPGGRPGLLSGVVAVPAHGGLSAPP